MKIRTIILGLAAVLCVLIMTPVLILCFIIRFRAPVLFAGKGFVFLAIAILRLKVTVIGREIVKPKTQYIFMANHQSFLDGPLLYWAVPGLPRIILKREIFRIPIVGQGMHLIDFISVDRKGLKGGQRSLDRAADNMARKGYSYLIFPEGTRSRDGRLQPLKRGGFFLALKVGVPVIPITIQGTFPLMPRGRVFIRRGAVRIVFHPPISLEGYGVESLPRLSEEVRAALASGLDEKESPTWTSDKKPES